MVDLWKKLAYTNLVKVVILPIREVLYMVVLNVLLDVLTFGSIICAMLFLTWLKNRIIKKYGH